MTGPTRGLAVAAALLLALGGLPAPALAAKAGALDAVQHVHINGFAFDPGQATIVRGDDVTWHNHDPVAHTATDSGGAWDTGDVPPGGSVTLHFGDLAQFSYKCKYHNFMVGLLNVNPPPNQAPTVAFTDPAAGASLQGTVDVRGTAGDPDGTVASVEVRVDGGSWHTASGTTTWSWAWDTTTADDGARLLEARGTDNAGATSAVAQRSVTVANPPSVSISEPAADATLAGTATLRGTASDPGPNGAVAKVEVRFDGGAWQDATGGADWTFAWDTTTADDGARLAEARATDAAGHVSALAARAFVVANPPTVTLDAPAEGAILHGTVNVTGTARDPGPNGSVARVEVRVDGGAWRLAEGGAAWFYAWDSLEVGDGPHTLEARSDDGALQSAIAPRNVTVDNHHPDLVVATLVVDGGLAAQTLRATIANAGDEDAGSFEVRFEYLRANAWRPIGDVHVGSLTEGAATEASVAWDTLLKVGNFPIRATADPLGAIEESREDNNVLQGSACVPDLAGLTCLLPPVDVTL